MDDQPLPPIQGPMFRIECNGMHFELGSPHEWVEDSRDRFDEADALCEFCDA